MKAILIEDEKAAVRNLRALLAEVAPQVEILAELDSMQTRHIEVADTLLITE